MGDLVLLRAASGAGIGLGHVMRARSIAQALAARGARHVLVVDDAETAAGLAAEGLAARAADTDDWTRTAARAAWLDGFRDWGAELDALDAAGIPAFLAENRTVARERATRLVYPTLHHAPDAWDRAHPRCVLAGPRWIPLAREVEEAEEGERDVDLLVTFGGSDPHGLTERALASLAGIDVGRGRVAILLGPYVEDERRTSLEGLVEDLPDASVLPAGTPPAPWMARSRAALTAVGTTLYELAYLGTPALVLANYTADSGALEHYAENGPHRPLGVAGELSGGELGDALHRGLADLRAPGFRVPGLGGGAGRLARLFLAAPRRRRAA